MRGLMKGLTGTFLVGVVFVLIERAEVLGLVGDQVSPPHAEAVLSWVIQSIGRLILQKAYTFSPNRRGRPFKSNLSQRLRCF